ncbi:hypothetical protein D3C84_1307030 [compost metagenome]
MVADHEQRGLLDLPAGEVLGLLPVAGEVAVPVQWPTEAVFGQGALVDGELVGVAAAGQRR